MLSNSMDTTAKVKLSNFKGDETAQRNLAKVLYARELGGDEQVQQLTEGNAVTLEIPWEDIDVFKQAIGNYDLDIEEIRGEVS